MLVLGSSNCGNVGLRWKSASGLGSIIHLVVGALKVGPAKENLSARQIARVDPAARSQGALHLSPQSLGAYDHDAVTLLQREKFNSAARQCVNIDGSRRNHPRGYGGVQRGMPGISRCCSPCSR